MSCHTRTAKDVPAKRDAVLPAPGVDAEVTTDDTGVKVIYTRLVARPVGPELRLLNTNTHFLRRQQSAERLQELQVYTS